MLWQRGGDISEPHLRRGLSQQLRESGWNVSAETVRRRLHRLGFVWRQPRSRAPCNHQRTVTALAR